MEHLVWLYHPAYLLTYLYSLTYLTLDIHYCFSLLVLTLYYISPNLLPYRFPYVMSFPQSHPLLPFVLSDGWFLCSWNWQVGQGRVSEKMISGS